MGAVALSHQDEKLLGELKKTLKLPSKSRVIRVALEGLKTSVSRQQLAGEIRKSVEKCSQDDLAENSLLTGAAFHRAHKE